MAQQCYECGDVGRDTDKFCRKCGARLGVAPPPEFDTPEKEQESGRAGTIALLWVMDLMPGLTRPMVVACSAVAVVLALAAFSIVAYCLHLGAPLSSFSIGAGGLILYWCGVIWLMYGEVCVPVEGLVEFREKHWIALVVATVIPGAAFLWFMKMAAGV